MYFRANSVAIVLYWNTFAMCPILKNVYSLSYTGIRLQYVIVSAVWKKDDGGVLRKLQMTRKVSDSIKQNYPTSKNIDYDTDTISLDCN